MAIKLRDVIAPNPSPSPAQASYIAPTITPALRLTVERLPSEVDGVWNRFVQAHPLGSAYHTTAWRNAIVRSFPHQPIYLQARRGPMIAGVLPMFLVKSKLAGRMLVSVPCGVSGGILSKDDAAANALMDEAIRLCDDLNCRALDLRSEKASTDTLTTIDRYVGFSRELPEAADQVLTWLPRKCRAAARNARNKHKLSIEFGHHLLPDVWHLYSVGMRRLASLNYPYRFFQQLAVSFDRQVWVSLVRWQGQPMAGLITLIHKDRACPYLVGLASNARRCSAANFIYLCAMERAVEQGLRVFDFGRSRIDNVGSCDFKRFHGFEPTPLEYQQYLPRQHAPPQLSPTATRYKLPRMIWPHLPLRLTQSLGAYLTRHIPG